MKRSIVGLALGLFFLLGSAFYYQEADQSKKEEDPSIILVRMHQSPSLDDKLSFIEVYKGTKKVTNKKINRNRFIENESENFDILTGILNKYHEQGYRIVGANEVYKDKRDIVTTYTFEKIK